MGARRQLRKHLLERERPTDDEGRRMNDGEQGGRPRLGSEMGEKRGGDESRERGLGVDREKQETRSARRRRHHHVARDDDVVDSDAAARAQCAEEGSFGHTESERLVGAELAFDFRNVDEVAQLAGGGGRAMKSADCEIQLF